MAAQQRRRDASITYESEMSFASPDEAMRLIAFYLPLLHPAPQMDAWPGHTEWHNIAQAFPLYEGHDQPRFPADLGYYDLRVREVFKEQASMARRHGIYGFCFYYYRLNGQNLYDLPLRHLLNDKSINMPFCLVWGRNGEKNDGPWQGHCSPADDLAFIEAIAPYLRDSRYIRIDGKPLLMAGVQHELPDPAATAFRWREWCKKNGIGDLFLVMGHHFGSKITQLKHGFDAMVECPPFMQGLDEIQVQKNACQGFSGNLFSYDGMVEHFLQKTAADFPLYKCCVASWDNMPREHKNASIFTGYTPKSWERWLDGAISATRQSFPPSQRMVFINAWNNWSEGSYMEPDLRWGFACLNSVSRCLKKNAESLARPLKILAVSHDAEVGGAQKLLLSLLRWMKTQPTIQVYASSLTGKTLRSEFEKIGPLLVLDELEGDIEENIDRFCGGKPDIVLANTVVTGKLHNLCALSGIPVITYVHEMEQGIVKFAGEEIWEKARDRSCHFLCASKPIMENLNKKRGIPLEKQSLASAFITPLKPCSAEKRLKTKKAWREENGVAETDTVVFGCGSQDNRKGTDLFYETAIELKKRGYSNFRFFWIGTPQSPGSDAMLDKYRQGPDADAVCFCGLVDEPRNILRHGDIFFLSSREDPFPLAALEAGECELPIICFEKTGGIPEIVEKNDMGKIIPQFSISHAADAVIELSKKGKAKGVNARKAILAEHTALNTGPALLASLRKAGGYAPPVSVIVPNYNYGHYLQKRIRSILDQTMRDFELIILDDASTDNSLEILGESRNLPFVKIITSEKNSGNVFSQWKKGLEAAAGEIIWIAEADDLSEPQFLETLLPFFHDPNVVLASCASRIMDKDGADVNSDYRKMPYMTQLSKDRWNSDYVADGLMEIQMGMGSRNLIFNVSSALFRKPRPALLEESLAYKMSGDWIFYLNLLEQGKIAYSAKPLNWHRRHDASVAEKVDANPEALLDEFFRVHSRNLQKFPFAGKIYGQLREFMDVVVFPLCHTLPKERLEEVYSFAKLAKISGVSMNYHKFIS